VVLGLLLFVAMIGGFVALIFKQTAPPRDAGHAFLGKVRKGDYDGAWTSTSEAYKKATPHDAFEKQMKEQFPEAGKSTDATFNSTTKSGSEACLGGSLAPGSTPIHLRVVEEGGQWRVDRLSKGRVEGCDE